MENFFVESPENGGLGEKKFRAKQVLQWIHQRGESDFSAMSNLAKNLRQILIEKTQISLPTIIKNHLSDDNSRKFLFDVGNHNAVESVYIPEKTRGTLCISTQVGCILDCAFCSTGKQGFHRNLSTAEIIGQLWQVKKYLQDFQNFHENSQKICERKQISNVVLMGMGEPLLNFDATISALNLMLDDNAYGLSRRRVTVSTAGVVPQIYKLAEQCPVALAISLHAPSDDLRNFLVPLNKKYPLKELFAACQYYLQFAPRDFITLEYTLINNINDQENYAKELVKLVKKYNIYCKFNLIPFNPFDAVDFQAPTAKNILKFSQILQDAGFITTIRKTRGDDILAACGQLAGQVKDKTARTARLQNNLQNSKNLQSKKITIFHNKQSHKNKENT